MAEPSKHDLIAEIRKNLDLKKLVLGTDRTLKSLKMGKLERVYMTTNCPDNVKNDILHYCKVGGTKIINFEIPNDELGTLCRKPFSISVVGLLRV